MGHLSTSDRVNTTVITSNGCSVADKDTNGKVPLCHNGTNGCSGASSNGICGAASGISANGNAMKLVSSNSNGSAKLLSNGVECFGNGHSQTVLLNESEVKKSEANGGSATKKAYFVPENHIDLEEYTKNFKGDTVLGIEFKAPLKWDKVIQITLLHMAFVYGFIIFDLREFNIWTTLFAFFTGGLAGFGVTGGAHRLWTHRSFKANVPLRAILMGCFSLAGQNTLYDWVRDHRVHHKFSETDADPHNSNRGFFFAHVGWLMMLKHPEVLKKGRQLDMNDILSDPVVQFHQKHFILLKLLLCFLIPTLIPVYCWGETWRCAFLTQCIFRYVFSLNFTWSVNSAAHMWGARPYDKRIMPSENLFVSICAMGEGWHNYHHVFPWDYKAAELGKYSVNLTTFYLDMFAKIGWAWDLKQPSKELVQRTVEKYGDGSHFTFGHMHIDEIPDPSEGGIHYDENKNFKSD